MKGLYSICFVTPYSGASIDSELNITRERVIELYFEPYFDYITAYDLDDNVEATFEHINDRLLEAREKGEVYDFFTGFAGRTEPEIYQIVGDHLEIVDPFNDLLEDGIKWIINAIEKEREKK